ncbi:hypothetical protein ACO2Q3_12620 [Caulobacter sp. KR2-114]|uniref:hypothetical protein n=1 Tax=Caulobacter sp. KR2-114 TaxID=3400912 RepID=UPI003C01A4B2
MLRIWNWRRRTRPGSRAKADGGFAAVDALTALTILTLTIGLSLSAAVTARRAAEKAQEAREASVLLRYLMETSPNQLGSRDGRSGAFTWRVSETPALAPGANPALKLCRRSATLSATPSGRTYTVATQLPCPLEPMA